MARQRHDDIEQVIDAGEGSTCALYSHGHLPVGVFLRAAEHYLGKSPDVGDHDREHADPSVFVEANVKREWWRNVPSRCGDIHMQFKRAKPRARGAYPVTVIDLGEWDR